MELLRRGKEIYYYKDHKGNEVDFLVAKSGKPDCLIQVSSDLSGPKVEEREVRSLIDAAERFKVKECLILTEDEKKEIKKGDLEIKVIPIWQWLLK